ncbi:MAG: hypothetical protein ACRDAM_08985, partial [Casimicrobium sp.]
GRDDLRLAPDEQTALMMTFLRLLAFSPNAGRAPTKEATGNATQNPQNSSPARANAATPVRAQPTTATQPKPANADLSFVHGSSLGQAIRPPSSNAQAAVQNSNPAASTTAQENRAFDGDWHKLATSLPLAAMAKELARHAVLLGYENNVFRLAVPQDKRPLATTQKERLANTLTEYFGRPTKVEIELTDGAGNAVATNGAAPAVSESIAAKETRVKDEKQAAAEAAFLADPAVQVFLTEGQGKIPAGSIRAS